MGCTEIDKQCVEAVDSKSHDEQCEQYDHRP
jgi:hypothetical protein